MIKEMTDSIIVKDIVKNTSVNSEGIVLFDAISDAISNGDIVVLSLNDLSPMSSSFMNSSFGAIIDKYGIQVFKENVKLTNYKPAQAAYIIDYLKRYQIASSGKNKT